MLVPNPIFSPGLNPRFLARTVSLPGAERPSIS